MWDGWYGGDGEVVTKPGGEEERKERIRKRASFAPGIFSVFFPFGRITAGTVGTVTGSLSGRRGSSVSY